MCLNANHTKAKTAKEDIIVFKIIKRSGYGMYNSLTIKGKKTKWEEGNHYTEDTPFKTAIKTAYCATIRGHAFHSKKTFVGANSMKCHGEIVKIMIIPKGAKYFENTEEYASSQLIYPYSDDSRIKSLTKDGIPKVELVG